jgi:hypothetical protein
MAPRLAAAFGGRRRLQSGEKIMNRLVLGVAALLAALSGCASPARYIERTGESGVVAIPANTDVWPSYNRTEAMDLIRKHVGSNFEIIEEREVATGKTTVNNSQVNNDSTYNRQTGNNVTTTQDVTEWRIAYRRKASTHTGSGMNGGQLGGAIPAGGAQPLGSAIQPLGGPLAPVGPGIVPPVGPAAGAGMGAGAGTGVYGSAGAVVGQMR